jgi:hypothetical protein
MPTHNAEPGLNGADAPLAVAKVLASILRDLSHFVESFPSSIPGNSRKQAVAFLPIYEMIPLSRVACKPTLTGGELLDD